MYPLYVNVTVLWFGAEESQTANSTSNSSAATGGKGSSLSNRRLQKNTGTRYPRLVMMVIGVLVVGVWEEGGARKARARLCVGGGGCRV